MTTVPTPTYSAGTPAAEAFEVVNNERSRCGFGKVAQNAQLDVAAGWQAEYTRLRFMDGEQASHYQDANKSGFQAVSPSDRAVKAGYATGAGENIGIRGIGTTSNYGDALVRALLGTVYHQALMLSSARDVGESETEKREARALVKPPALKPGRGSTGECSEKCAVS